MKKLQKLQLFIASIVMAAFLGGCVQALMYAQPLLTGAMVAVDTHNTYASTKTGIENEKTNGNFIFEKIAIWPDNECEVYIAENLELAKISVSTPAEICKVITKNDLIKNLKSLTYSEMEKNFLIIGEKTGADAILVTSRREEIFIYSVSQKKEIWSSTIRVARKHNSTHLQLMKSVADDITKKIIALKQEEETPKTSQN